ncbi:hypothetical protein [Natrialba asiatica]|uniref:Uncharacterized protein n=1 Tax=Natrialba asiatica (strain ATCC 700177 / DSM 12278 / JCM 9576 / FERM P-10747 / NBRC 102637 / 172P1) TaxID=29540 RepID=M0AY99_NATA1|nr:hypothetical protein [Natrialba asiatica]ELZ02394.1 hypothetical protein C481_06986 [Natrialba asiatica DSM 12278]
MARDDPHDRNDPHDRTDRNDGDDDPTERRARETGWLATVRALLDRLDRNPNSNTLSPARRGGRNRSVFDYSISIRTGDDLLDDSRFGESFADEWVDRLRQDEPGETDSDRTWDRDRDHDRSGRPRTRRSRSSSSTGPPSNPSATPSAHSSSADTPSRADSHHITTRTHDDELLVIADVSGADADIDADDVTVGFSDTTLVIVVAGTELDRIDVPWSDRTGQAAINNGVLTVRVQPVDPPEDATETGSDGDTETETDPEGDR